MRRSLLNKPNLSKSLCQALVLFTLLLLPSVAWGDTVFTTGEYDASKSSWIVINPKEEAAGNWVPYGTAKGVTCAANGTNPYYLDLTFEAIQAGGTASNITFKFENSNFGKIKELLVEYDVEAASPSFSLTIGGQPSGASTTSNTGSFTFSFTDAKEWESLELKIEKWETSASVSSTIKSIAITTDQVSYNLNIGGIEVTNTNADNITGDGITLGTGGKVSFIPGEGDNPGTLTLNNATIEGDIISQALTINLVGNNTISGKIHPSGYDVSEGELAFTGTENSSLTINASVGSAAIYNYTSVNFGSYKLTTSTSPGVYYNSDYHNLWTDHIGDGNSASNVTLTTKTIYPLWIGNSTYTFIQVTEENKSNILGDSKISFDGTNTLTLSEATLVGSIISGLSGGLTIVVDKENFINMTDTAGDSILTRIRNIAPNASLTIKKSNNEGNCSLVVNGPIKNFSSIGYENGIYLSSAEDGEGETLNPAFIYYNYSGGFQYKDNSTIKSLTFSTTKPSESIWIGEIQVGEDGSFTGIENVSFDEETKTLTLNGATISNNIISSLPNLTINLAGENRLAYTYSQDYIYYYIISSNPSATLTFTTDGDGSLSSDISNYGFPWKGFAGNPTFKNKLVFTHDAASERIKVLSAPEMSYSSSISGSKLTLSGLCLENEQFSYYYAITYADNEGNISKTKKTLTRVEPNPATNSDDITITHTPFTVEASVIYEDQFGNTIESETAIGKYFGFADKTITFNTKDAELPASSLELSPTTEDVNITGISSVGSSSSGVISLGNDNKATIVGIGSCDVTVKFSVDNDAKFQVLNPADGEGFTATGSVTVLPDKPTIVKEEKDYLDTDKITITRTSVEGESADNIKIFYTWDEEAEIGSDYTHNTTNPTLTIYTDAIPAQSGTLRAWVGYSLGDGEYLMSEEATPQEFEVKKDIASCTVILPENAPYKGSAYEPVVEKSAATTTTLSLGTDYTVSYQKVEGETATDVESMIDAGTYKITITGIGNYGGTSEVENFQISQASLEDAAITTLIVGDTEYGYDPDKGFVIPYTGEAIQPDVVVTFNDGMVIVDPSEYTTSLSNNIDVGTATLTLKSAGINFIAYNANNDKSYKEITFEISRAPVTITAENQEVTYNATAQEYDISEAVSNENAIVTVTYYATEADLNNGENALSGAPTDADTYYVRVALDEESQQHFIADPASATFTIEQLDISQADITLDNNELTYNGQEKTVSVTKVEVNGIVVDSDNYLVDGNKGTEAREYTVTVTAKPDNDNFKNNFVGSAEKVWKINHRTATASELGFTSETQIFSTYYNPDESFNLPEGYVAYIITGVGDSKVLTTHISYIPMGVAVLVEKGTSSEDPLEEIPDAGELPLKGTAVSLDVTSITGGTVYVLYQGEFVKSTSGTIPAKRCYLLIDTSEAANTRAFTIDLDGEGTTGISTSITDDGQWTNDNWYDLQGRRIKKPTKAGLYIVNGKKVVVNIK